MKKSIYTTGKIPQGKNGLTSRANFIQRKKYKTIFEKIQQMQDHDNYIDLLNSQQNIFKTYNNEPINVSETVLKNIEEDIYAINFVADAFIELKNLCKNDKTFKDEKFTNLKAKKGWLSLHKKYHEYMTSLFNEFLKNNKKLHKDKKINNFESFILNYIKFLDNVIYKTPFLKSSYFLSNEYATNYTGFIIDIDDTGLDEDSKKFSNYLVNYEYNEFVKLCKKTNFLIDNNCPWRLVYDLNSQKSEEYMSVYGINENTLVDTYFYKTKEFDLENLKNYMIIFYNTFVQENPSLNKPILITKDDKQTTVNNINKRYKITIEEVNSKYNNNFWFNIYTHLSFVENKLNMNQQQYLEYFKITSQTLTVENLQSAFKQLEKIIQNTEKCDTRGEYNFIMPSRT